MKVELLGLLKSVGAVLAVLIPALLKQHGDKIKMQTAIADLRGDYEKDVALIRSDMKADRELTRSDMRDDRERTEKFENRLYAKIDALESKIDSIVIAKSLN